MSGIDIKKLKGIIKDISDKKEKGHAEICTADEIDMSFYPTGIDVLDTNMGGGFVKGGMSLLYGPYSAGKSTLALKTVAKAQEDGYPVLWVNSEGKFNTEWARKVGVDTKSLAVLSADTMDKTADVIIRAVLDDVAKLIVWDSLAAVSPKQEKYTDTGKLKSIDRNTIGLIARTTSKISRFVATDLARLNASILFISQMRTAMSLTYSTQTAQGGNAIHHNVSLIIKVTSRRKQDTVEKSNPERWPVIYRIEKNQINGIEWKNINGMSIDGTGPHNIYSTLEYMKANKLITRNGSYYVFDDLSKQGWDNFVEEVTKNKDIYEKMLLVLDGNTINEETPEVAEEQKMIGEKDQMTNIVTYKDKVCEHCGSILKTYSYVSEYKVE